MLPAESPQQPHPFLVASYMNGYTKGRQEFVATVIASLSEPAFADLKMTSAQFADMLRQASEKCDQVKTPLEKQN
jgi:hypothetical protein